MKTYTELHEWREGAAEVFGDPSAVTCQLFFRWLPAAADRKTATGVDELVFAFVGGELQIFLDPTITLPLPVVVGKPKVSAREVLLVPASPNIEEITAPSEPEIEAFGLEHIAAGLWQVHPSLDLPGVVHAFLVLYDVPEPAPWANQEQAVPAPLVVL